MKKVFCLICIFFCVDSTAEDLKSIKFDYSATMVGGVWSSNRRLDGNNYAVSNFLKLKSLTNLNKTFAVKFDGIIAHEYSESNVYSPSLLREVYLNIGLESADIRFGKQLIPWGRADKINPTDFFSRRDYQFLTSEDEEQKIGINALSVKKSIGDYELQAIVAHNEQVNRLPFYISNSTDIYKSNTQYGLKLDHYGSGNDWSVSYYNGIDRTPNLIPDRFFPNIIQQYNKIKAIGFDFASTHGDLTYRGELAYSATDKNILVSEYQRNNQVFFIIGFESSPFKDSYLSLQYFGLGVKDFDLPTNELSKASLLLGNQLNAYQDGITARFAQSWMNDSLMIEIRSVIALKDEGVFLFPKFTYRPNNSWAVNLGGEYYGGKDTKSYLGQFSKNSNIFLEGRFYW